MSETLDDTTRHGWARCAGFMYLFVMAVYVGGVALTRPYIVPGDAVATAGHIAAGETLYRVGLALQLIASWTTILLGGAFYVLLRPIQPNLALLALLWRTAEATLGGAAAAVSFMALENLRGGGYAWARVLSAGYSAFFHIAVIFFSLGSILFFGLLFQSRYIPRALAAFGVIASVLVAVLGFLRLILPTLADALALAWAPIFIAEIATGAWLLWFGAGRSVGR